MDHVVVWLVFSFAVSPGTWPGGAWVPGGPRPCFLLLLLVHDPNFVFRNFHQDVSRFTVHKGLRPNSRIMYRFFTSHQPMMNEQDQVTWTNWPASKKKRACFCTLLCTLRRTWICGRSLLCVVLLLLGPCTWEPGRGVPGCRGGPCPFCFACFG